MIGKLDMAVILAAGLGSRLGKLNEDRPKALLKIGNQSLIERSIQLLIEKGISKIIIGTGYGSEYFDDLSRIYPQVTTCKNPKYDSTGSMYTLYLTCEQVSKPFLLLEGDLLFEGAALDYVMEDNNENIILASDATHSGDEVFIQSDGDNILQNMSKQKSQLATISGELVGISKLSVAALNSMIQFAEKQYSKDKYHIHYEDALVGIANDTKLYVKVVESLAWCEIDDPSHLERAISIVYPEIMRRT